MHKHARARVWMKIYAPGRTGLERHKSMKIIAELMANDLPKLGWKRTPLDRIAVKRRAFSPDNPNSSQYLWEPLR